MKKKDQPKKKTRQKKTKPRDRVMTTTTIIPGTGLAYCNVYILPV